MSSTTNARTYTVVGMSCEHCVNAVTDEVAAVDGVTGVDVDLASGTVTVQASGPLDDAAIGAAVVEAGYALTP